MTKGSNAERFSRLIGVARSWLCAAVAERVAQAKQRVPQLCTCVAQRRRYAGILPGRHARRSRSESAQASISLMRSLRFDQFEFPDSGSEEELEIDYSRQSTFARPRKIIRHIAQLQLEQQPPQSPRPEACDRISRCQLRPRLEARMARAIWRRTRRRFACLRAVSKIAEGREVRTSAHLRAEMRAT